MSLKVPKCARQDERCHSSIPSLVPSGDLVRQWRAQGREYTAYLDASESLCPKEERAYTRRTVWKFLTINVSLVVDRRDLTWGFVQPGYTEAVSERSLVQVPPHKRHVSRSVVSLFCLVSITYVLILSCIPLKTPLISG